MAALSGKNHLIPLTSQPLPDHFLAAALFLTGPIPVNMSSINKITAAVQENIHLPEGLLPAPLRPEIRSSQAQL